MNATRLAALIAERLLLKVTMASTGREAARMIRLVVFLHNCECLRDREKAEAKDKRVREREDVNIDLSDLPIRARTNAQGAWLLAPWQWLSRRLYFYFYVLSFQNYFTYLIILRHYRRLFAVFSRCRKQGTLL
jgi:hypothetical protein